MITYPAGKTAGSECAGLKTHDVAVTKSCLGMPGILLPSRPKGIALREVYLAWNTLATLLAHAQESSSVQAEERKGKYR